MNERLLDNSPIAAEIMRWHSSNRGTGVYALATRSGVSAKTLYRHMSGEATSIRRDNAELIAGALGRPMAALYPEMSRDTSVQA
jgi:lambda repressor-like predicted transcriptional regulator